LATTRVDVPFLVKVLAIAGAGIVLASCPNGSSDTRATDEHDLRTFVLAQRLPERGSIRLVPDDSTWAFLGDGVARARVKSGGDFVIAHDREIAGFRLCEKVGAFSVSVPHDRTCLGEWMQNRGDERASGLSTFRLNWPDSREEPPQIRAEFSLGIVQPLDPVRLAVARSTQYGRVAFVQNGDGVEAFAQDGRELWKTGGLGLGEIIDVVDLDNDGEAEVVYSTHARVNPRHAAATEPGGLFVLSAKSGEVLWRYRFSGLELGLNRYRTTIAHIGGKPTLSILAVLTYDATLLRFDFDQGARNGRLAWRSAPMAYDSPDKAPLVVDFDHDGRSEVIVDALGVLYVIDAKTGAIRSQLKYSANPTFGGFLVAADLDGDGKPEIVSTSSSVYMKGYAVASWVDGKLVLRHSETWEEGLEKAQVAVRLAEGLFGSPSSLVLSITRSTSDGRRTELQAVDVLTGAVRWRLADHDVARALSPAARSNLLATQSPSGATLVEIAAQGPRVVEVFRGSRWVEDLPEGTAWAQAVSSALPSKRATARSGLGVLLHVEGGYSVVRVRKDGQISNAPLTFQAPPAAATAHVVDRDDVVLSDGRTGFLLSSAGATTKWFEHSARAFVTPLVADLEGKGQRSVVVPYGAGVARIDPVRDRMNVSALIAAAPAQDREAFRIPVIADLAAVNARVVVGFEAASLRDGSAENRLASLDARGKVLWSKPLAPDNWETSIATVRNAAGGSDIAFRDSRATELLNERDGSRIWFNEFLGQCQRQMASGDFNGDGTVDLAVQAGPIVWVYDGRTGKPVWTSELKGSYAANSTFGRETDGATVLAQHGTGGFSLVRHKGVVVDMQLDLFKVESIPLVAGPRRRGGPDLFFQVSGDGHLRVFDLAGKLVDEARLPISVLTMTGAYVNDDDAIDLLISTFAGQLIAISGADLTELWRVNLGAPVGTAVATEIDGSGKGEIVAVTTDGTLHRIVSVKDAADRSGAPIQALVR
jgi:outer membrane protein assembly factor BamB